MRPRGCDLSELDVLEAAIFDVADWLERQGVSIAALKRRDPREPGRRQKEQAERKLAAVVLRRFKRQLSVLRSVLESFAALRQSEQLKQILAALEQAGMWADEDTPLALSKLLSAASLDGVALFAKNVPLGAAVDLTPAKSRAFEWAAKHTGQLIKGIDQVTLEAVRSGVLSYIETGMSLSDLAAMLPFDDARAMMIAGTEVTAAYAEGNTQAGLELQSEFPELVVLKVWHTERDERVCEICEPMDEQMAAGGVDGEFKGGDGELYQDPPAHPNCRCWTTIETAEGGEGE